MARAALEIGAAAHVVEDGAAIGIHQQAVDGEVAAQNVLPRVMLEMDTGGAAAVAVVVIAAKGGHFGLR